MQTIKVKSAHEMERFFKIKFRQNCRGEASTKRFREERRSVKDHIHSIDNLLTFVKGAL